MKRTLKMAAIALAVLLVAAAMALGWYLKSKQVQRSGVTMLRQLSAPVSVAYDERGVPHIHAGNEADLYRALGYVHA